MIIVAEMMWNVLTGRLEIVFWFPQLHDGLGPGVVQHLVLAHLVHLHHVTCQLALGGVVAVPTNAADFRRFDNFYPPSES